MPGSQNMEQVSRCYIQYIYMILFIKSILGLLEALKSGAFPLPKAYIEL